MKNATNGKTKNWNKLPKRIAGALFLLCTALLCMGLTAAEGLPARLYVSEAGDFSLASPFPLVVSVAAPAEGAATAAPVRLFGLIPVGQATVEQTDRRVVVAGGEAFGLKIAGKGAMVVGFQDVPTPAGPCARPGCGRAIWCWRRGKPPLHKTASCSSRSRRAAAGRCGFRSNGGR